jgi:hypothetical protein
MITPEQQLADYNAECERKKRNFWVLMAIIVAVVAGVLAWFYRESLQTMFVSNVAVINSETISTTSSNHLLWGLLIIVAGIIILAFTSSDDDNQDSARTMTRITICCIYHTILVGICASIVNYTFYELTVDDVLYGPARFWKTFWVLVSIFPAAVSMAYTWVYLGPNRLACIALFGLNIKWFKFNKLKPGPICLGLPSYLLNLYRSVDVQDQVKNIGEITGKPFVKFRVPTPLGITYWTTLVSYKCIDPELYYQQEGDAEIERIIIKHVTKAIRDLMQDANYPDIDALMKAKDDTAGKVKDSIQSLCAKIGFELNFIINSSVEPDEAVTKAQSEVQRKLIEEQTNTIDAKTLREEAKKMVADSGNTMSYDDAVKTLQVEFGTRRGVTIDNKGDSKGGTVSVLPIGDKE